MITIEVLRVMFEAEREKDEARFGELFAFHMARYEMRRPADREPVVREEDRTYGSRRTW
jgi:hypothetical protein